MSDVLTFMGDHPILTFALACCATGLVKAPFTMIFRMWNRWLRHRDIKAHGWPPPHLNADGDWKPEPKTEAA